jgi:hypothetical protein
MLAEIADPRQIPGEGRRRWFRDDYFDLIVWLDDHEEIFGFQLCYDKFHNERALTWRRDRGFRHERVDDGEITGHIKMTPILIPDGEFAWQDVAARFRAAAAGIDPGVAGFVYRKLCAYPG